MSDLGRSAKSGKAQPCTFPKRDHDFRMTPKQKALQVLGTLPEDASYEDLQEEVRILAALDEAERDVRDGRVVSHEEAKRRLAQWTSS